MSKKLATKDAVEAAAQNLLDSGVEPSIDNVRSVTRGSDETIAPLLRNFLQQRKPPQKQLPALLENRSIAFAHSLWASASEIAQVESNQVRMDAQVEIEAMQTELLSAKKTILQLQTVQEIQDSQIEKFRTEIAELRILASESTALRQSQSALQALAEQHRTAATDHALLAAELRGQVSVLTRQIENSQKPAIYVPPERLSHRRG